MLTYEQFKDEICTSVKDYFAKDKYEVKADVVKKTNYEIDSINVKDLEVDTAVIFYVQKAYDEYQITPDMKYVTDNAIDDILNSLAKIKTVNKNFEEAISDIKNRVVACLINTERNEKLLKDIASRPFLDLSIVYRVFLPNCDPKDKGTTSFYVQKRYLDSINITEEELYKMAMENTRKLQGISVQSMEDVIRQMLIGDGMPEEVATMMTDHGENAMPMIVLSNNNAGLYGASSMLYNDELRTIADKLDSDLFIIPSSVHEVILMKVNVSKEEISDTIAQTNATVVEPGDFLSDMLYRYNRDTNRITIAL